RRWLSDKPIKARPPTRRQRAAKWAWRHQALVVSAALVAVLMATCLGWIVGDRHARRTEAERRILAALATAAPLLAYGNPHDPELVDAVRVAEAQLASGAVRSNFRDEVEQLLADRAMLVKLEEIRMGLTVAIDGGDEAPNADFGYAEAFREYGID